MSIVRAISEILCIIMKFAILAAEKVKSYRKSNSHNTCDLLLLAKSVEILDRTIITNYNLKFNNRQSIMQYVPLNIYYVIVVASVLNTIDIRSIHILIYVCNTKCSELQIISKYFFE